MQGEGIGIVNITPYANLIIGLAQLHNLINVMVAVDIIRL